MASRHVPVAGFSLIITFSLLFVMQALIAVDELDLPSAKGLAQAIFQGLTAGMKCRVAVGFLERPQECPAAGTGNRVPAERGADEHAVIGAAPPQRIAQAHDLHRARHRGQGQAAA